LNKLNLIKNKIKEVVVAKQLKISPQIIAVTKTFEIEKVTPLLKSGHIHYGENKLQEAETKWIKVKNDFSNIKLHMLGKLQSNKAKKAIKIFDFIHSLDSEKLAKKLSQYEQELNKKVKFFIQVNIGDEKQKSGIELKNLNDFYHYCFDELSLNVIGLMCLPPMNENPNQYFELLKKKSEGLKLTDLSMGMSGDFMDATSRGSTYLRLGTAIFGERKIN